MRFFGKPSKHQFANRLVRLIAERHGLELGYDRDTFSLHKVDADGYFNLANVYAEHCQLPRGDRAGDLERLAEVFGQTLGGTSDELPDTFDDARPNLRPKIWTRWTFELLRLEAHLNGKPEMDVPSQPLGEHLVVTLVFDTEHTMRSIGRDQLEQWDVTLDAALERALANLQEATTAYAKMGESFATMMTGDNYDSARILLTGLIEGLEFAGDPIAIVPHRDAMLVADSEDQAALPILFDLSEADEETNRPLSPLPLVHREGAWSDWTPPRNHALRGRFDERELNFLGPLYAEQKQVLEAQQEAGLRLDPAFLASFSGLQNEETGGVLSYSVWSEDVETLLPATNHVVIVGQDGRKASGEWDRVMEIVGDLVAEEPGMYPARYRTTGFPTGAQLDAIGESL